MAGDLNGMQLLFGDSAGSVQQTAEPKQLDGMQLLFGDQGGQAPQAEKKQGGNFISRTIDAYNGKHDPRFKDVPAFRPNDAGVSGLPYALSTIGASDDAALGDVIQKSLGDKFVRRFKDANGYDLIEHRATPDGQPTLSYVNKPGLDVADVARGVAGAVPFVLGGGIAGKMIGKTAPAFAQVVAQAGAAGGVSLAGDALNSAVGSEQSIDGRKALMTSAMGAAGQAIPSKAMLPAIGATAAGVDAMANNSSAQDTAGATLAGGALGWAASTLARRLLGMSPGLYVKDGKLTDRGAAAAKQAGINPADVEGELANTFGKNYAMTRDAAASAVDAKAASGIPLSRAQRTGARADYAAEDSMLAGMKGADAQSIAEQFYKRQDDAVKREALGFMSPSTGGAANAPPNIPSGVMGKIAPRNLGVTAPGDIGSSIQGAATAAEAASSALESQAWKKVGPMEATTDALDMLPNHVRSALQGTDVAISEKGTPVTSQMLDLLRAFKVGKNPGPADEFVPDLGKNIDAVRRQLGKMTQDAEGADKIAAGSIYDAYKGWIKDAAEKKLINGDHESAAALFSAIDISREAKGVWQQMIGGKQTPAAKRLAAVLNERATPESVVHALVGDVSTRATIPAGAPEAIRLLKNGLQRYAPDLAERTMQDIKAAYWLKMVTNKGGDINTPGVIVTNIKSAMSQQRTLFNEIMGPADQKAIMDYMKAVERVAARPRTFKTNASGSGFTVGVLAKEFMDKVWQTIGLNSKIGSALVDTVPGVKQFKSAQAREAFDPQLKEIMPILGKYGSAAGSAVPRDSQ